MKIVCLTVNFRDKSLRWAVPFRCHSQHLQDELARREDVVFYGEGIDYNPETNVEKIVKDEKPDILFFQGDQYRYKNIDKTEVPKFLVCGDPWSNIFRHAEYLKENKFTGALMLYPCAIPFYRRYVSCNLHSFPYAIDIKHFKDLKLEREIDVFCSGSFDAETHPLRHKLLVESSKYKNIRFYLSKGHGLSFEDYVKKLNQSKIFCFDDVYLPIPRNDRNAPRLNFTIEKWIEGMACNMLVLAPELNSNIELHFQDKYNFVNVNINNFMRTIQYYLFENEDEGKEIAKHGYETVLKYHTVEIRVSQLIKIFEETLNGK